MIPALFIATCARGAIIQQYTLTDLGTLSGGNSSHANGINNAGQIVGASNGHAFLYSGGVMTDIDAGGSFGSEAYAINSAGQVVGKASFPGLQPGAFRYSSGTFTNLGEYAEAHAINDAGKIAGSDNSTTRAVTWSAGGAMSYLDQQLSPPSAWALYNAMAINTSGQVAGSGVVTGGSVEHAYRFSAGAATDLGSLTPYFHQARGINDAGTIVGVAFDGNSGHGFRYSNGIMTDIGNLGGVPLTNTAALDVNNAELIVGYSTVAFNISHAITWANGTLTDLNTVTGLPLGYTLTSANSINDFGQIVGAMDVGGGFEHAFLLTPIPEPGAIGMIALTGGMLIARRRSRARYNPLLCRR